MYKEINKEDIINNIRGCKHRSELIRKLGLPVNGGSNNYIKTLINNYNINENDYYNTRFNTSVLQQISKENLQKIVYESNTYKKILEKLGYKNVAGSSYRVLKDKIIKLGIDISQMTHYKSNHNYNHTDEEVFCEQSKVQQNCLRNRVLKNKVIPYKCNICGNLGEWNGKPLTLTLDHINGNRTDNRIENLRFLCPNCDRQQDTFGAKNKVRYYEDTIPNKTKKIEYICETCGKAISWGAKKCIECSRLERASKIPSYDMLLNDLINFTSFVQLGKKYNVSYTAVKKWLKKYSLPYKVNDVQQFIQNNL